MSTVVIYDSGVGGLSIYQEFRQLNQDDRVVFVSDNAAFPYGTKDDQSLEERVIAVSTVVMDHYSPDILVVACNTASTVMLPKLREAFDCHIVGVVPAIKPASQVSKSKIIGVVATPATIDRIYTEELIQEFASDCHVVRVGSSKLVDLAESKLAGEEVDLHEVEKEILPILESRDLDVLVLACTHFPLLRDEFNSVIASREIDIQLIDSGAAIARRIVSLSSEYKESQSDEEPSDIAVLTASPPLSEQFATLLGEIGFKEIDILSV